MSILPLLFVITLSLFYFKRKKHVAWEEKHKIHIFDPITFVRVSLKCKVTLVSLYVKLCST